MRFLITRPKPDADALARKLEQRGHKSWLSPVMKIIWHKIEAPLPAELAGLIITSRNALRSLEKWHNLEAYADLPLFAVGKSSAKAAGRRGFTQIYQASGRAAGLPPLIGEHLDAKICGPLWYPCGKQKAFDLTSQMESTGFHLVEQICYASEPVAKLAPAAIRALENATLDGVLLLSPRSARLFAGLVRTHKLQDRLSCVAGLCLSQNVADTVDDLPWRVKLVAPRPEPGALLDLIEQIAPCTD